MNQEESEMNQEESEMSTAKRFIEAGRQRGLL